MTHLQWGENLVPTVNGLHPTRENKGMKGIEIEYIIVAEISLFFLVLIVFSYEIEKDSRIYIFSDLNITK